MALTANFIADFSSFIKATQDSVAAMTGFKDTAADIGPAAEQSFQMTTAQAMQLGASLRDVGSQAAAAARPFIDAFTEEQDAVNKLTTALQATGQATPEVTAAYSAMASEFQRTTTFADEAVTSAMAVLTTIGTVGPDNMQLALEATTNLASAMKMDLNQAALLVAKAFESGGEHLGKLKGLLGEAYTEGMSATEMLQALNEKFGPAAQNELQTYNGQIAHMNNQMSDFNEKVGKVLVDTLSGALAAFQSLPEPIQTISVGIIAIGTALAPVLISLSSLISILATTGIGAGLATALTSIIALLTGPVGIVIAVGAVLAAVAYNWDAIVDYTKALYEGIKRWLVDGFNSVVESIKQKIAAVKDYFKDLYNSLVGHSIIPDTIDGIRDNFSQLDRVMVQPVAEATAQVNAHLKLMAAQMRANALLNQNSLFTTTSTLENVAAIFEGSTGGGPFGGGGGFAGGAAAPVTVNNTFNIVDTESNIAQRVSQLIMQTIRSGTQLGTT